MKNQLSLSQLAAQLETRAKQKQDMVVDTRNLMMSTSGKDLLVVNQASNGVSLTNSDMYDVEPTRYGINEIAHNQIAGRLDIPVKYYNRMREEAPEMLAANVNHWLEAQPEKRLVRTLDGNVRAFLSDRYQRIENEQIASVVLPELLSQEGMTVEACAITETRMYIKAVFSKVEGEIGKGDVVQAGVIISNSEVGMGAVNIQPLVYRLVCLNGLILPDSKFQARHVGGRISKDELVYEMLSDEAIKADDSAILLKVRDVLRASFDSTRFARQLDVMRESAGEKITGNPVEAIKVLSKKLNFNEFEQGSVLRHLIEGGDLSKWGVLNAVTRTAQDVEDFDRSIELEQDGGKILYMPANDWQQMAQAA